MKCSDVDITGEMAGSQPKSALKQVEAQPDPGTTQPTATGNVTFAGNTAFDREKTGKCYIEDSVHL